MTEKARAGVGVDDTDKKELDLNAEWERQARTLADLFAEPLGLSIEEYIATLPRFTPQLPEYRGRFDTPVIVQVPLERRVLPFESMLRRIGISKEFSRNDILDWPGDPQDFITKEVPYVAWLNTTDFHLKRSPEDVRNGFAEDERGGTVLEGLALYLAKPEVFSNRVISFPGSSVGNYVPLLRSDAFSAVLHYDYVDISSRTHGSLTAGREITMGKMQIASKKPYL